MAPVPRPPNLLPHPTIPASLFLAVHGSQSTVCSLTPTISLPAVSPIFVSFCLHFYIPPELLPFLTHSYFFFFYCSCLLPCSVLLFLTALPPFFCTPCTYGNTHSIGCKVNKSEGLAGTCHQQHHPACLHQTTPSSSPIHNTAVVTKPCKEDLHAPVLVKSLHLWKSYLVNSRMHRECEMHVKC